MGFSSCSLSSAAAGRSGLDILYHVVEACRDVRALLLRGLRWHDEIRGRFDLTCVSGVYII